ncbi:sugar-binding protein [Streptomyces cyaneochromogenes]|uniref:Sugar-binding protein n=1 Tax=Streptomyces cyaneochromogenes TaxID=2496836 RepID=A0A3S5HT53_9ACTN|nr:polymorphic toxin-type HINT domain-containing protein [Streptomyces cyaneochromogenes]AZQ32159.1 sugar-binding protein [Streptomyces cyaneochromogenes]
MVATLLQATAFAPAAEAAGKGRPAVSDPDKPVAGTSVRKLKPRKVQQGPRTPQEAPKADWPEADSALVTLKEPTAKAGARVKAKGLPVELNTPAKRVKSATGGTIEAEVVGQAAAKKAGVDGVVFTLKATDKASSGAVGATLDYADFAEAFGGAYASRLTLVELPACALTTPKKKACRTTEPVVTDNDTQAQTLTTRSVSVSSSSPTVLAATAGDAGKTGDYKATSLSPSATWSTDLNTGDFAWSYDIPVPEVPGGFTPHVGMSYSSGSIDGRTGNTNNQSSWVGDGFELSPGFIERRYKPCADDGQTAADGVNKPGDLCWGYDNAYITFNGRGGELVPTATEGEYRFRRDDGTRVHRLTDTGRDNKDDNGEYWRVTDPKGNRYYFGYNRLPGWATGNETTDSTWTVPVFGDDSDEPCNKATFAESWCQQAWRWNLDYAVDTHGNAMAYYYIKEENSYGRNLKATDDTPYARGGYLDRIEYGLKSSSVYSAKALAKVDFISSERCIRDANTTCSSISTDSYYWYDTPWDLNCTEGTDCDNNRLSPSFWTRKRLTGINSQVLVADGYSKVDSWALTHRWGQADVDYQLLLDSIQRTGHTGANASTLPKTTLAYTQLANRLDSTGDGYAPFIKARLSTVADEHGGQIDVNYSAPACDAAALPTPETNSTRCFPLLLGGTDTEAPKKHWFNKYVVTSVTATDRTGGAPDSVTAYEYLGPDGEPGGAAWHYDDDDGLTKEKNKTWSQWRGYGHVRVKTGGQGGAAYLKTQADTYFLRGMHGDRLNASGGTKSVSVPLDTGEGAAITDHESAAGFAYKTAKYSGPGGSVLKKTVERPWHHETAKKTRSWGTVTANFTGTDESRTWTSLDDGAGSQWRTTLIDTTYDTVAGRVTQVDDQGDTSVTTDDVCTRTTYATNTTDNILTLPSRVETVSVKCATTPVRTTQVVSDVRSAYDGLAYGAAPTKGDETATATLTKHNGTTGTYLEAGSTFDGYGRTLTVTDLTANVTATETTAPVRTARTDGLTSTTAYTPATGFPTTVTTTTPRARAADAASAQTTTTTLDGLRGMPTEEKDTNGKFKTFTYDALGRADKIWLADRKTTQLPSYDFDYLFDEGKPVAVRTLTLDNAGAGQIASYTLYDGLLRARQTQDVGPDGGRLLTDTFYDERGLVAKEFASYYTTGTPSRELFKPVDAVSVETQTWHSYDGLNREITTKEVAGSGDGGPDLGTTTTTYGGDRTTVIPPEGGTATTSLTDARGRTSELRQHHTRSATATYDATTYKYTPTGKESQVTDPAGNKWFYEYDLLGNRTESTDPDQGVTISTYDDRSRLVTTKDSEDRVLYHLYDQLGRKTELRDTSATGTLRASWTYDTIIGAKGQLASSTRYVNGAQYVNRVTMYDLLYRPVRTSMTIPTSEGDLAGTYQSGTSYQASGKVGGVSYSAAGALPGGSYSYTYDSTLRPVSILGDGFQADTTYSNTGKPLQYAYASTAAGAKKTWVTNTYEWGTQRLATTRVDRQDVAGIDRHHTFGYDKTGNVLSIADVSRAGTDTQCFTHDYLRRMTKAWTEGDTACSATPSAAAVGGVAPYWQSYTYDKTGNRKTEIRHDPSGDTAKDTTRSYTYPPAGGPQPHTLTEVNETGPTGTSKTSYLYDKTGNTTDRVIRGTTQKLAWDAEGRVTKVTQPVTNKPDEVTDYVYDAEGNRLIARGPNETTLYLGHTEVVLPKGTTTTKATRYIGLGSGNQAVQSNDGSITITVADHVGTGQLSVKATDLTLSHRRTLPFGGTRGTPTGTWTGTKAFVGGTDDTKTTGLVHLGAREYDATIGRFISVDPVMDSNDPQQINGYAYSNNSPVTFTDPDGLKYYPVSGPCVPVPTAGCKWKDDGPGIASSSKGYYDEPSKNGNSNGNTAAADYRCGSPGCSTSGLTGYGSGADKAAEGAMPHDGPVATPISFWDMAKAIVLPDFGEWKACKKNPGLNSHCGLAATDLPAAKALKLLKLLPLGKAKKVDCKCFLAGTDVLMADGSTKNIEDIELGDKVVATDPQTGKTSEREVTATVVTENDKRFTELTIATENGEENLTATDGHPFWSVSEHSWIRAGDLKPGMTLRTDEGPTVEVQATRHYTDHVRTYNLTIEGVHTYYVLVGDTPVLVHNTECPTGDESASSSSSKKKRVEHLQPNRKAEGDHTVWGLDENGRVIRYQTWLLEPRAPSGWRLGPRFRGIGKPHSGVNPPLYYPKGGGYGESATGDNLPLGY